MAETKIDLSVIKEQINKRKQEIGATPEQKKNSRDNFLTELLQARNNGVPTKASEKIKIVEKVSDKVGVDGKVPTAHSVKNIDPNLLAHVNTPTSNVVQQHPQQQYTQPVNEGMMPERDNRYDAQVNNLYNQYKTGAPITQPQPQPNQFGMLTEQQVATLMEQQGNQLPQGGLITEQVSTAINGFINDNMGVIVEQAMKNAVMEMYSIERIRKTLDENRDLIRSIVLDTFKEIQNHNKTKKTQATKSGK